MLAPTAIDCADCPDADGDSHGFDFHDHCTCSSHAPRVATPVTTLGAPSQPEDERYQPLSLLEPPSPDPNPILHVPKR